MADANKVTDLEFKWGKKRRVGLTNKKIQFYESFTYDGVEYTLYDCVYMHKEGEPEPYIGKLIKIWENSDKAKKVKVQWFFHPSEILNWLGDEKVPENEIFLASGEGDGLANVNPLEAIAGKCNVVCISKDSRNRQPSAEELEMADYIFYRTFDVKHCTVLDEMDDKVGGLEIKFIFNRKASEDASGIPKPDSDMKKENKSVVACNDKTQLSRQNTSDKIKHLKIDGNHNQLLDAKDADVKDLLIKCEHLAGVKPASEFGVNSNMLATTSSKQASSLGQKVTIGKIGFDKVPDNQVKIEERLNCANDSNALDKRPAKKVRTSDPVKSEDKSIDSARKLLVHVNDVEAVGTAAFEEKTKCGHGKDPIGQKKGVKSAEEYGDLEDRPSKIARVDYSIEMPEKNLNNAPKMRVKSCGNHAKDLIASGTSNGERTKSRLAIDSLGSKSPINKEKPDNKIRKVSKGKLPMVSAEDGETKQKVFDVTQRPCADKSKWFRPQPWEKRMKDAHENKTLLLLQNLDPEYTSGEIEDIIWHAFQENCAAKMIQRTAISSPHYGQAFIIFKTREATERALKKLNEECLMLPNGRPLVGSTGPPLSLIGNQSTYFGHLVIDKHKIQQREMKDAVSTSHCSQPNTIEYEMAMEWCLLQSRSDRWWNGLYKQQAQDLTKLVVTLKSK